MPGTPTARSADVRFLLLAHSPSAVVRCSREKLSTRAIRSDRLGAERTASHAPFRDRLRFVFRAGSKYPREKFGPPRDPTRKRDFAPSARQRHVLHVRIAAALSDLERHVACSDGPAPRIHGRSITNGHTRGRSEVHMSQSLDRRVFLGSMATMAGAG